MTMPDPFAYHSETKHHFNRFARSPGRLDWDTQPDPFRTFVNAPVVELPFLLSDPSLSADHLFTGTTQPEPITLHHIAGMLELSLGLSCWKEVAGSRWALRMNPSSGNLHPTEAYLVLPGDADIAAGVYHYAPFRHALEQRCELSQMPAGEGFFIGLTTIFWRESWKYGERAYRYCNLDAGHAMAAIRVAANLFGWRVRLCTSGDDQIETLLGLNRTQWHENEAEHPEMLLWVGQGQPVVDPLAALFAEAAAANLKGRPNRLSRDHRIWNRITEVAEATRRSGTITAPAWEASSLLLPRHPRTGAGIIRQRRSAVDTDAFRSHLTGEQFRFLLDTLLPRHNAAPFDCNLGAARIHPVFLVHKVEGFAAGLYIQVRNRSHLGELQDSLRETFLWEAIDPARSLFLLERGAYRAAAAELSCGQEICGNSALAVAMIGRFNAEVTVDSGRYRELFWEAGMIGQVLYLQAEMSGQSGTGIGCFFDDPVHRLLGISDESYQTFYHFTLGYPLVDQRISSHSPYFHLSSDRLNRLQ